MSNPRAPAFARAAALAWFAAGVFTAGSVRADVAPYVPAEDTAVLEHVPPARDPAIVQMTALRRRLDAAPNDLDVAVQLARAYIDFGRRHGEARYLGYAEAALASWTKQSPPPVSVAMLEATLLQSRHEFAAAEAALRAVLAREPREPLAWLTIATVATVQADFDLARRACARLLTIADRLTSLGCIAGVASVTGDAERARRLLVSSLPQESPSTSEATPHGSSSEPGTDAETLAWLEGLAADAALRVGRSEEADAHFKAALALTPGDNFLLADYADFLLDENRPREVITLLQEERRSDTSFLRLVLAETVLEHPDAERDAREMAARFAALDRRGEHLYGREQARFVLAVEHDPGRALDIAARNFGVQRAPWDIRVYLAAALAAQRPEAAAPALDLYMRSGLEDARIAELAQKLAELARQRAAIPIDANDGAER